MFTNLSCLLTVNVVIWHTLWILLGVPYAEHFRELLTGRHFDFSLINTGLVIQMDGRELFFRPVYLPYPKEIDVVGQIGTNESVVVFCEKLPKDVGDGLRNQGVSYITHWDMCSSVLLD